MSRRSVFVASIALTFVSALVLSEAFAQAPDPKKAAPAAAAPKAAPAPAARPAPAAPPPRAAAPAPAPRIAAPPRPAAPPPPRVAAPTPRAAPPPHVAAPSRAAPPAPPPTIAAPKRFESPARAAAPQPSAPPQTTAAPAQTPTSTPAITRDQARQQIRELQTKQQEELRGKNLNRAERLQLRAQQRDQLHDLQAKQREQINKVGADTQEAGAPKPDVQTLAQDRQQLRELQTRQWRDLRNRNLSRTERRELIAKQRDELRALRTEQDNRRLGSQQQTQQQQAQQLRRDGKPRVTADTARRGRFAALVQNDPNLQARRAARIASRVAARQAWRQGRRAAFVAWAGPVFYPYAYSDIFEYTFWPYAYDDAYWAYFYDDFVDSIFWVEASPYSDYAYGGPSPRSYTTGSASSAPGGPRNAATMQLCSDPGKGITAWPFTPIEQAVRPNAEQRGLLEDLKHAAAEAAGAFKAACTENFPLTPPGRLAAMTNRLDATLQAVRIVHPALDAFYNSLSDEQKARFTAIGPDNIGAEQARQARDNPRQQDAKACGGEKQGLTNLPIERIEDAVQPTGEQQAALDRLDQATSKAVELLAAACPDFIPLTPVGRLEAMEKRLDAMVQAGKTMQPALEEFYASLGNEQKARFNMLGQQAERGE